MRTKRKFDRNAAEEICDRMAEGESLVSICQDDHLPSMGTVFQWLQQKELAEFRELYVQAVHCCAHSLAHKALETVDRLSGDDAQTARARFDGLMSIAAKLAPTSYSERMMVEHTGDVGGPMVAVQINLEAPDHSDPELVEHSSETDGETT